MNCHLYSNGFLVGGVETAINNPGAREQGITWIAPDNNIWIFGGWKGAFLNDMWRYNTVNNRWTWMHGDSTKFGSVFGTKGVYIRTINPGGRYLIMAWWTTMVISGSFPVSM